MLIKKLMDKYGIKFAEGVVLVYFCVLLYFDFLLIERIKVFFFVLLFIGTYLLLLDFFSSGNGLSVYYGKDIYEEVLANFSRLTVKEREKDEQFQFFVKLINKLYKGLLYIYKYKSFIFILLRGEKKLFFGFRKLNSKFINYPKIFVVIYGIIMCFVVLPVNIVLNFFYKAGIRYTTVPILELLFKRIDGLMISTLFLTKLFNIFALIFIQHLYVFVVFFYLGLVIFSLIICFFEVDLGYNKFKEAVIERGIPYGVTKESMGSINGNRSQSNYGSLVSALSARLDNTIVGNMLQTCIYILKDLDVNLLSESNNEDILLIPMSPAGSNCKFGVKIIYINIIMQSLFLLISYRNMAVEVKNKPSLVLYHTLTLLTHSVEFANLVYAIDKCKDNDNDKNFLMQYFNLQSRVGEQLMFRIGEIEYYFGKQNSYYFTETCMLDANKDCIEDKFMHELYEKRSIRLNDEKIYPDLEDNINLFCEILSKLYGLEFNDMQYKLRELITKLKADHRDLMLYEFDENERMIYDPTKLMQYIDYGNAILKEMRKRGEEKGGNLVK